ncbi:hypothetical protein T439DRAFT_321461 [Meredithblackwellia eburnea MCA 4105]
MNSQTHQACTQTDKHNTLNTQTTTLSARNSSSPPRPPPPRTSTNPQPTGGLHH